MPDDTSQSPQPRRTYVRTERPEPVTAAAGAGPLAGLAQATAAVPATAIIAWHGMGQQLPCQTVETVARGLAKAERHRTRGSEPAVTARLVELGTRPLWRAELDVTDDHGRPHRVHVYEAYWAAYTEGKITLAETVKVLLDAGYHGVHYGLLPPHVFQRFLFNRWVAFGLKSSLAALYLILLGTLFALIVVNFAIATVLPVKLLTGVFNPVSWPSDALLGQITVDLSWLALAFGLSALVFTAAYWSQKPNRRDVVTSVRRPTLQQLIWILIGATVLVTLLVGTVVAWQLFVSLFPGAVSWRWRPFPSLAAAVRGVWDIPSALPLGAVIGVWLIAIAGSAAVRWFLLEFVGDSAIYVSSHKLNRFFETRQTIKATSLATAEAIYRYGGYARHILMGHSLGSVIAYDTLNRLLNDDRLASGALAVKDRTRLLLTFGSVLDKVAFLFRAQSEFSDVREALAAATQPLISDADARPRWINIFSRHDFLGGSLEYFDPTFGTAGRPLDPASPVPSPVENIPDPGAWIPGLAHEQYWTNDALLNTLRDAISTP
jgi:hypothetical protein